jgi:hypothetical protein
MASSSLAGDIIGGSNGTLAAVKFPADELEKFLYTKVIVSYTTIMPTSITGEKNGSPTTTTPATGDMKVGVKTGYNKWSDTDPGTYRDITTAGDGEWTFDLALFTDTGADSGTSFQENGGASGWLFKVTKLEFTTQDLIDFGPATGKEVVILGTNNEAGSIEQGIGNVIKVDNALSSSNIGFGIVLPTGWKDATKIIVDYEIEFPEETGKLAKFTTKCGASFGTTARAGAYSADITEDGEYSFEVTVANLKTVGTEEDPAVFLGTIATDNTLTFQINAWLSTEGPQVMKFNMIILDVTLQD